MDAEILKLLKHSHGLSSGEIFKRIAELRSKATVKRTLTALLSQDLIVAKGSGRGTRYYLSPAYEILRPIDMEVYYLNEIDDRKIIESFNFDIFDSLGMSNLFISSELEKLTNLKAQFDERVSQLSELEYKKEFERLAIDLSWKSSQIEGNTYSLLETERLIKDKETAKGKTKEEAIMLLNHKDAIDFLLENRDYLAPISLAGVEDIHRLLVKDLGVVHNLRKRRVGISGTNYRPLDNELQIREAIEFTCKLINAKENIFEKALLALVLISYIQPFMDGNKRTARITSNAILMNYNYCPISYRTVDSIEYKKAMLLFYEQNNLSNFKQMFINQFEFAVNTYF